MYVDVIGMVLDNVNRYMIWIIGFVVIEIGYGLDFVSG